MSYCPFCGRNLKDGEFCGCNQQSNIPNETYDFPWWATVALVIGMLVISGASLIGLICGLVLKTSGDPRYRFYGQKLFKLALIVLIVKVVFVVITFLITLIFGVGVFFFSIPYQHHDVNEIVLSSLWMI